MDIRIDVEADLAAKLINLAKDTGRPPEWLIARAIEDFVTLNAAEVATIREAIAEADRGELATDEEIEAVFRKLQDRDQQS